MSKLNPLQKVLYKSVSDILWYDWDPIEINTIAPRDEYESYVPHIFSLLTKNSTSKEIAEALYSLEKINMGLPGSIERCTKIAEKLIAKRNENSSQ